MKYYVAFQQMGSSGRPIDHPTESDIEADEKSFNLIPSTGDYVQFISMNGQGAHFDGKVKSRLFRYFAGGESGATCAVNIVIEDAAEDDWGALIKE